MSPLDYAPPVDRLFELGEREARAATWMDYRSLGLGPEHAAEIRRLMHDQRPFEEPETTAEEFFGRILAGRALAQILGVAALEDAIEELELSDELDNDWIIGDFIRMVSLIGGDAIPRLRTLLAREAASESARHVATEALGSLGAARPECRAACLDALQAQLGRFERNTPTMNGFLAWALVDLKGAEAASVIEMAFQMDCVDPSIVGEWPEVKHALGLHLTEEERRILVDNLPRRMGGGPRVPARAGGGRDRQEKKKRRKQDKSRRRR